MSLYEPTNHDLHLNVSSTNASGVPTVTSLIIQASEASGSFGVQTVHRSQLKTSKITVAYGPLTRSVVLTINP